ncbi:LLM class flavin-dependent oxidoreductase, partial [bacterium]|nr:LLM class flavin-dependent oxidoreductase [bacterium]
ESEARAAFDAWIAGDRKKAVTTIPDHMIEAIYVLGSPAKIARRLRAYERAGITAAALQFTSYAKDPVEKRKRILAAIDALAGEWPASA